MASSVVSRFVRRYRVSEEHALEIWEAAKQRAARVKNPSEPEYYAIAVRLAQEVLRKETRSGELKSIMESDSIREATTTSNLAVTSLGLPQNQPRNVVYRCTCGRVWEDKEGRHRCSCGKNAEVLK